MIWTIGHSTRNFEEFTEILRSFAVETVVDIRSYPGSRHYPQFNKDVLERSLPENGFQYYHLKELGGRRRADPDSENTAWRHPAFRGYADYMETDDFKTSIKLLEHIAMRSSTVYMCSEAVWWRCHRSMVSDYFKLRGWKVMHIMGLGNAKEHPYTDPARVLNGELSYSAGRKLRIDRL